MGARTGINDGSAFDTVRAGVSFIPGAVGDAAKIVTEGIGGHLDAENQRVRFHEIGMKLRDAPSRAARRKLVSLDNLAVNNATRYSIQAIAGIVGGFLGAALLGPLLPLGGGLIGGLAGSGLFGYGAGRIYEGNIEKNEQDAVNLAADCYCKLRDHEHVSREMAFATLMANLPPRAQKRYEDILENMADTRDFRKALESREGLNALHRMMNDPAAEAMLRDYLPIPLNGTQHIADQYTDLLNNGHLDARDIILNPKKMKATVDRYYMQQAVLDGAVVADNTIVLPRELPAATRTNGKTI